MCSVFLIMALGLGALTAQAQSDPAIPKWSDRYEEPGFGALAFIISDSTFFERWERPETPQITPQARYVRGEVAYPIVIFQTDALDEHGHVNVTYDLTVMKPDGTLYAGTPVRGLIGWKGTPPPGLVLALNKVSLIIEDDDQPGLYTVDIVMHDQVRGKSVPLSLAFEVTE